ncbi:unnamed protein product [Cylindrotheca closterium]|uniref:Uncharacterized protein n=1 Tax=Cylindrotheca closterium TaxID=2856 RepID=A0AAD2G2F4_9STRA|nr:unnamed protein product [Cylindrotheca closterium]
MTVFQQKEYTQMLVSNASLSLGSLDLEEESSVESSDDEERASRQRALLDAKLSKTFSTIAEIKKRRTCSIDEGPPGLLAESNHSNADYVRRRASREQRKRSSGLSASEHCPAAKERKEETPDLSLTVHGPTPPTPRTRINRNSDLDLDSLRTVNLDPLKAADIRRRRNSLSNEPSAEDKRRARLLVNHHRRRSLAGGTVDGEGQQERNSRELVGEKAETRSRLQKRANSKRTLSNDSDAFGFVDESSEAKQMMDRTSSSKRLSGGSASGPKVPESIEHRDFVRRSGSRRTLSNDSDTIGFHKESPGPRVRVQRSSVRRKLSIELGPIRADPSPCVRKQKIASSLVLSELGVSRRDSGSNGLSAANRRRDCARYKSFRLSGNSNETWDQSPPDKKNFTWTWRNDETEPTLRRSNTSNTSPSQIRSAVSSILRAESFTSPPQNAKNSRRLSMPSGSDLSRTDHPMSSSKLSQRNKQPKKSPTRTSKFADSLLSPAARRRTTTRSKETIGLPGGRTQSLTNLPLAITDSKTKSNRKKGRSSANLRRQASSKTTRISPLETNCFETSGGVVNKNCIGAIAMVLKQSNEAKEELEFQKEEEREAKRSHVRARRRQLSVESPAARM